MENKHILKLVEGDFVPSEASTVLLELINSKIRYHHLQAFKSGVTGDGECSYSLKRIEELEQARHSLKSILHYASNNGMYLKINGSIEIVLEEVSITAALGQL